MDWRDQIPGCFGNADVKLAVHPLDEERAKKAIAAAKSAGAKHEDFEKEIVWHVYREWKDQASLGSRIHEEVKRFHRLWKPTS